MIKFNVELKQFHFPHSTFHINYRGVVLMTRETAKRRIKGFPLNLQSIAKEDIDERAYVSVEIVPLFELDGGYYQMTVNYKIKLDDGYIYGKASCLDEFVKMHDAAARGEVFSIMYLERSRIIIEIEERDD